MRIGFVIYGSLDTLSGGYLYDRKLVEYLRSQGDTVEIISLPWRNYAAHLMDNFSFRLPHVVASRSAATLAPPARAGGQSPDDQFDVLIQDELNHPSLILANQGEHPYPIVSLVHHLRCSELRPKWQNTFYRLIERKYLQSVDAFIFNSRTTAKVVNDLIEERKLSVIAYPPTDRFGDPISQAEIRDRAQTSPLRILFLGNVIYRKGLHTLLQAVSTQPAAFCVDVVGSLTTEPAYVKLMQELIAQKNLSSSVFLHGSLDAEPLIEKLRQAHVLVVPSSYEGFGIVYLEGMCFGLPAIGTTVGAASEVIEHERTGYLIAPDDEASLAAHLTSLAEDRGLLTRLSLNARERYLRQPKWEKTAASIREFLHTMTRQAL
ncbi:MAG TPA: glycosyltransferase family 4 protein [Anaerolineales bacterium]|nr:glycosyltransferase family 4 protein [Anaerolineales bacterium]